MIDLTDLTLPELDRLWTLVAARLERNGLQPRGVLTITELTRDERHALAGLLGRAVTSPHARVDLAILDSRVRAALDKGLVAMIETLRGPLVDRPAQRLARNDARHAVSELAREGLRRAGLYTAPWAEAWLDELRRTGVVARIAATERQRIIEQASVVLGALPGIRQRPPELAVGRGELATLATGSAHGLDDDTLLATIVLRAVAAAVEAGPPTSAADRRRLWRLVGVTTDDVSTTVLTAGLFPADPNASWLRHRSERGWETHLTRRDLSRVDWSTLEGRTDVHVCENPRVLEAALHTTRRAVMVCTQGNPTLVVHELLGRLCETGRRLHYHGDFDWAGIGIANGVFRRHDCLPWLFGAADYEEALVVAGSEVSGLPLLEGPRVEATWDPELAAAMARVGRAIHEELVLDLLIAHL